MSAVCPICGVDVPRVKDDSRSVVCDECRDKARTKSSQLYKIIKQAEVYDTGLNEATRR